MQQNKYHIFLLGPPAVGKMTVGKAVSHKTGFPLFENAKTVDMATLLYPYGTYEFRSFRDSLRFLFYREAVTSSIKGLISTYCYRHPSNADYLMKVSDFMGQRGWQTLFFLLLADVSVLKVRVESSSRKVKYTFKGPSEIDEWISSSPEYRAVTLQDCIIIDNSLLSVESVANFIVRHLGEIHESTATT